RIVGEVDVAVRERVAVVGAGRVARLGYGDAFQIRQGPDHEMLDDPPAGELGVRESAVAVVGELAATAEPAPQRIRGLGEAGCRRPGLRVDPDGGVDDLEVVIRSDRAVLVRRRVGGTAALAGRDTVEIGDRRRNRTVAELALNHRIWAARRQL